MYRIPLIKPYVTEEVKSRVLDVLDSGYLTEGPVTREFEESVRNFLGCGHVLAMTSCTTGMETALRCLGVGPGDEIIVPDYTYPATASAVNIVGATAVIVDVDPQTMNIDYDALEAAVTDRTRGVIPVSLFGNPLDYDRLDAIKAGHGLFVIEDAACSLGAEYKGARVGTQADIAVFSCHPRKFITTGEGGLVVTDNPEWADWMLSYKHFGMGVADSRLTASFDRVGTNYKLSNVLAAIGLAQMSDVDALLAERRVLAARYTAMLTGKPGVTLPGTPEGGVHSWQTYCVLVNDRDAVMTALREAGIEAQIGTYSLHMHPAFNANPLVRLQGGMDGSRYAFDHALALPMFHGMREDEQQDVAATLAKLTG